uniref:Uncharacterized protein n=1 Tax=Myoviridae sp. ctBtT5 TaxID=2825048 RepID=A0A8S5Q060_9CAUD|nr:MAG TPA: hypothetical protein [Myoviridae sp. ctBtT5]
MLISSGRCLGGNDIDVVTNTTYEFLSSKFRLVPT